MEGSVPKAFRIRIGTDPVLGSTSGVNGDQAYATITLASGGVPKAYAELWACGRTS